MAINEFRADPGQILTPAEQSPLNRTAAVAPGVNLTIVKGQAMGQKTSDKLYYAMGTSGVSDGTQLFVGFAAYAFATDANGQAYAVYGGTSAGANYFTPPQTGVTIYTGGVFNPSDIATATQAEVDTWTLGGTIASGDVYSVIYTAPSGQATTISFTATTSGATSTVTGLKTAWAANTTTNAAATASGTSTFILTAATTGFPLNVIMTTTGAGTISKAITTAATTATLSAITSGAPGARLLSSGYWEVP